MTRTATAVIGSLHGDEGKGAATAFLASPYGRDAVVVRTNGGAQAGHTVVDGDRRHVFHHVGSGTFSGAATHLARRFVSHPMFLAGELRELASLGSTPRISADPRGAVTTPWDVMVNQIAEARRSGGRHGSCGMGFGETVGRCSDTAFGLTVADLAADGLADRLRTIRDGWTRDRLAAIGAGVLSSDEDAAIRNDGILDHFLEDCRSFVRSVEIRPDEGLVGEIVFEGAQGLLLDQDYGAFPHVTRSHTGIRNMLEVAAVAGIVEIEAFYAFRPYATRHGAGPLPHETTSLEGVAFEDPTNVPNPWQGGIRLAPIDLDVLVAAVRHDLSLAGSSGPTVHASVSVSCLDQIGSGFGWRSEGSTRHGSPEELVDLVAGALGAEAIMTATGPAAEDRMVRGRTSRRLGTFAVAA